MGSSGSKKEEWRVIKCPAGCVPIFPVKPATYCQCHQPSYPQYTSFPQRTYQQIPQTTMQQRIQCPQINHVPQTCPHRQFYPQQQLQQCNSYRRCY